MLFDVILDVRCGGCDFECDDEVSPSDWLPLLFAWDDCDGECACECECEGADSVKDKNW